MIPIPGGRRTNEFFIAATNIFYLHLIGVVDKMPLQHRITERMVQRRKLKKRFDSSPRSSVIASQEFMAFIRKRGNAYYLVHNIRKKGRVLQLHLACLGRRPRIDDEVIQGVAEKHPFVRVDWNGLKEKASRELVKPVTNDSEYLRGVISQIRNFHLDLADLQLPHLEMTRDRELEAQILTELRLLRGTLEVKLNPARKGNLMNFRGRF